MDIGHSDLLIIYNFALVYSSDQVHLAGGQTGAAQAGLAVRVAEGGHRDVPELVHVPLPDDPGQLVPRLRHLLVYPGPEVGNGSFYEVSSSLGLIYIWLVLIL